jgi:hypothetical protein
VQCAAVAAAHDAHYAITHHSNVATRPWYQGHAIASTVNQKVQDNRAGRQRFGPTCGFTTSPEVGLRAIVSNLQTGYPYVQVSSQDKERDVQPCATTCPAAPNLAS